eukprot:3093517-Alexandrium_andersonii.AAC.1
MNSLWKAAARNKRRKTTKSMRSRPDARPPNAGGARARAGADTCRAPDQNAAAATRPEMGVRRSPRSGTAAARRPATVRAQGAMEGA